MNPEDPTAPKPDTARAPRLSPQGDREFFSAQARLFGDGALNWLRLGNAQEAYRLAQLAARSAFIALDGEQGFVVNRAMREEHARRREGGQE